MTRFERDGMNIILDHYREGWIDGCDWCPAQERCKISMQGGNCSKDEYNEEIEAYFMEEVPDV